MLQPLAEAQIPNPEMLLGHQAKRRYLALRHGRLGEVTGQHHLPAGRDDLYEVGSQDPAWDAAPATYIFICPDHRSIGQPGTFRHLARADSVPITIAVCGDDDHAIAPGRAVRRDEVVIEILNRTAFQGMNDRRRIGRNLRVRYCGDGQNHHRHDENKT